MIPLSPNEPSLEPSGIQDDGTDSVLSNHQQLRSLFASYRRQIALDGGRTVKAAVAREIVRDLSKNTSAQERALYPTALHRIPIDQRRGPGSRILYDSLVADDKALKTLLHFIDTHTPETDDEWAVFDRQVDLICTMAEMHMGKVEEEVLARLRLILSSKDKKILGREWKTAVQSAPVHPHSEVPCSGALASAVHPLAGIVDYVTDTSRGLLERLHLKRGIVQDPEEVPEDATPLHKYEQRILMADDQPATAGKVATSVVRDADSPPVEQPSQSRYTREPIEQLRTAWTEGLG